MQNPMVYDFNGGYWNGHLVEDGEVIENYNPSLDEVVEDAYVRGHDGVIALNIIDQGGLFLSVVR